MINAVFKNRLTARADLLALMDEEDVEEYELPDVYDDCDYSDEDDSTFEDDEPV